MEAKRNHVIVKCLREQKESVGIDTPDGELVIYMGRAFNENGRESSPVVGEVIAVGEGVPLKVGQHIIVHHNMLLNDAIRISRTIEHDIVSVYCNHLVYAILHDDGALTPIYNNFICERILKEKGAFDVNDSYEEMKFKVVSAPEGEEDVKAGDIILCYKLSDYEMVYHHKNKEKRVIRIYKEDILAICEK